MVSLWPWKGDDRSPASFEKALSSLSIKISKSSGKLDSLRQRSRRFSVLWTLYAGFAYLLYTIILVLVVGWRQWGPAEYAAVAGGPVLIYLIRLGLSTYYEYRTSRIQGHLDDLQKHRDDTVEKLKTATKYNSTQELLKKYGGTPTPKVKPTGASDRKSVPKPTVVPEKARTSFIPPPTANIPRQGTLPALQSSAQNRPPQTKNHLEQQISTSPISPLQSFQGAFARRDSSAEFAPNAFSAPPQYAQNNEGSRWYDRIMDVLLGEDETRPGARLALICDSCRLVNGQAPPGVKHLEDLGKWRCGGCGAMNGEETEAKKLVANIREQAARRAKPSDKETGSGMAFSGQSNQTSNSSPLEDNDHEDETTQSSSEGSEGEDQEGGTTMFEKQNLKTVTEPDPPRRRSTRPTKKHPVR